MIRPVDPFRIGSFGGTLNELFPATEVSDNQVIKCTNFKVHKDGISRVKRLGYTKITPTYNFGGLQIRGLFDYWDETELNRVVVITPQKIFSRSAAPAWVEIYTQTPPGIIFPVKPIVFLRERPIVVGLSTNRLIEPTTTYGLGIEAPTTAPTLAEGAAGNLTGTFKYVITYLRSGNFQVESNPSPESSPITVGEDTSVHRARTTNVATIGTAEAHGLAVGNEVIISDLGGLGYNGTWTVASVPDSTHFTYANTGTNETETADTEGTIKSKKKINLSAIPVSSDPKVDKKRIYRTTEGGAIFFWVADITNATTTYEDNITELGDQVSYDRYPPPNAALAEVWDDRVWFVPKSARNQLHFTNKGSVEEMAYDNIIQAKGKDSDEIMALKAFKIGEVESLYLLKHKSMWRLDKLGESSYELNRLPYNIGTDAPGSVATAGGLMFFLSKRGIEIFNGESFLDPPISDLIPNTMASINQAWVMRSFGEVNEKQTEYWLSVPTESSTEPNLTLVLDYLRGKITPYQFAKNLTAMHNIRDANSALQFITGSSDGNVYTQDSGYTDDGTPIAASFMTKQFCSLSGDKGVWNSLRRMFANYICPTNNTVTQKVYINQKKSAVATISLPGNTPSDSDRAREIILRRINLGLSCAYFCLEFINNETALGEIRVLSPDLYFRTKFWKTHIKAD